jgi:hypothetical protein
MLTVGINEVFGGGSVGCAPKPSTGGIGEVPAQAAKAIVNTAANGCALRIEFSSNVV